MSTVIARGPMSQRTCPLLLLSAEMVECVFIIPLQVVSHALELHQERLQASKLIVRLDPDERMLHLDAHQSGCRS